MPIMSEATVDGLCTILRARSIMEVLLDMLDIPVSAARIKSGCRRLQSISINPVIDIGGVESFAAASVPSVFRILLGGELLMAMLVLVYGLQWLVLLWKLGVYFFVRQILFQN